ncbi:MAG TPA: isoprenylcysteine carboxylmethyltransferase family protein [Rhizomicrobium sp.]|nr:isoprenylcysteine carboxylmethyltransferase family protein [Rhizomicrobium sp.]
MVKVPPPIWGLIYLLVAAALSALYPWRALIDLRLPWLGVALIVAGFALSFSAFGLFRRRGTEIEPTSEKNTLLVIEGPFRFTRNPMYLGLVIFTLGIAFCVGSLPMFAVPVLIFATANWVHIPFEQAKMRRQFGAAYDDYARAVRRWL